MRKIEQGLDWIDSLWSDYVMDMDRETAGRDDLSAGHPRH